MRYPKAVLCAVVLLALGLLLSPAAAAAETVRVGLAGEIPAYQSRDELGNWSGMHIELLREVAAARGLSLEFILLDGGLPQAEQALMSGSVDVLCGVNSLYGKFSALTNIPFTTVELALFQRKGSMKNDAVVYEAFTVSSSVISRIHTAGGGSLLTGGQAQMVDMLLSGRGSVMVGNKTSLLTYLRQLGIEELFTVGEQGIGQLTYYLILRSGYYELYRQLDGELSEMRVDGRYAKIDRAWTIDPAGERLREQLGYLAVGAAACAAAAFVYIVASQRIRNMLRSEVAAKTAALSNANETLAQRLETIESQNVLQNNLIQASPAGMVFFDERLMVRLMNEKAIALAGLSMEPLGESVLALPVFGGILSALPGNFPASGTTGATVSLPYGEGEGKFRYSLHPVGEAGRIIGGLLTVENVTDEEKKRQALWEKEKNLTLNRLITGLAHEIKNPLTAISASAELIGERWDSAEYRENFERFVPGEVVRINHLVENLLDYARPARGVTQMLDAREMMESSLTLTAAIAKKSAVSVSLEVEEGLSFYGMRDRVRQILFNVLLNGIEAMQKKEGGSRRLAVRAFSQGDYAVVTVRDDGIGMDERQLRSCAELFYTTKPSGTGIGLALSKQYLEENGGSLSIESVKGEYTEVRLCFERRKRDA
jgi:polar amino acid transport system substrate-binding protein